MATVQPIEQTPTSAVAPDVLRFNRACALLGLLFLLLTVGWRTISFARQGLPQSPDYPQYYMGGLIARHGEWPALYPVPNPGSGTNPGDARDSTWRPAAARLAEDSGVGIWQMRYMQPPPLALFLIPLSFFSFKFSYYVWTLLLTLAAWGIGLQAAKMYSISRSRVDRFAGAIILLVCLSPQAHRWARVGNMSVLIGWLIGYVALELVRGESTGGAFALMLGTLAKYAVAVLVPVHIVLGRWKTLLISAAMGIGLVLLSLAIMHTGPYREFLTEIVPRLGRTSNIPENHALYAFMLRARGINKELGMPRGMELLFRGLQGGSLLVILAVLALRRHEIRAQPRLVFGGALALVSWLLIFSPIFWEHYHAYLGPFWGWLAAEAIRSRGRMIAAVAALLLTYFPTSLIMHRLFGPVRLPEPLFTHLLWATVIMGAMGVWAMVTAKPVDRMAN